MEAVEPAVNRKFALEVQANTEYLHLFTEIAECEQAAQRVRVTNDEEDVAANQLAFKTKDLLDGVVILEQQFTKPLHLYKTMIHDAFRGLKDRCTRVQNSIGKKVLAYRAERDRKWEAERNERLLKKIEAIELSGGSADVEKLKENDKKPKTTVKVEGGRVYEKEIPHVIVENKLALVKAIVSKAKAHSKVTLDLVDVNQSKLNDLVLKAKVSVPGVKVEIEKKLVPSK